MRISQVSYWLSMKLNESETRVILIDPLLKAAGWDLRNRVQVGREIPVDGYDKEPWNGITDYCLYDSKGDVIAVVEAKKCSRTPRDADEQLRHYVTEIAKRQSFAPFGFMSNGQSTYFWEVGQSNPRLIAGFFSLVDLERLRFIRQNQKPLEATPVNSSIAGRPYQQEAIRRVSELFSTGKRRALIVMATGTGKTRTTMALIDLFLRSNQARNVLFLADRDALVDQALTDGFKTHLPNEPRDRIYTHQIDTSKRLFVATQQTMNVCFTKFSPGFFDLIILDEAHRSIFNRFTEVIEYFDARMIGLTATPANFIDRDTFRVFQCENSTPAFLYTYEQAVKDGFLVDFSLYQAQTSFQRTGIKGIDLEEEDRNSLIEQGIDPDAIDFSGTAIEVEVSNTDTLRKQIEEFREVCIKDQSGQVPGKTIVFAMTKDHANRIRDVYEELYPQDVGMISVITSSTERVRDGSYGDGLITKFKKNDKPRIAVSVDMLDTGLDVPEVVNLVFMRPIQSQIKLCQMIGRGTRNQAACRFFDRLPDGKKTEFKIIDFWQNDFSRKADEKIQSAEIPVLVSVFNTRLKIVETLINDPSHSAFKQAVNSMRFQIKRIPIDCFPVKKVWMEIEQAWDDGFWLLLTKDKIEFLKLKVAPLLRFAPNVDVSAETFTNKVERFVLQTVTNKVSPELLQAIAEDVSRLPDYILSDTRFTASKELCLSHKLAKATPDELSQVISNFAWQMKNRRERPSAFLNIDLPDFIAVRGLISIGEGGEQVYVAEYKKRVEEKILKIIETHPAIEAIRLGKEVDEIQLISLEKTLHDELAGGDIQLSPANIRRAYGFKVDSFLGFLKHLLNIDTLPDYSGVVQNAFTKFIGNHPFSGDQIRFLRALQDVFLQKRKFDPADLYEAPLTSFGRNAADRLFTPEEIQEIVTLTGQLALAA